MRHLSGNVWECLATEAGCGYRLDFGSRYICKLGMMEENPCCIRLGSDIDCCETCTE